MWLFAGFLALPLIEIALFVTVGGWLGLWLTLAIVLGTGTFGVMVIRWQGVHAVDGLRRAVQLRRDPMGQVADSALVVLAGVLLILPGFLTDSCGLLLLVPPVRRLMVQGLSARVRVDTAGTGAGMRRSGPDVIDGEFFEIGQELPEDAPTGRPPSGWTRH